jgi:hypothetical protein
MDILYLAHNTLYLVWAYACAKYKIYILTLALDGMCKSLIKKRGVTLGVKTGTHAKKLGWLTGSYSD